MYFNITYTLRIVSTNVLTEICYSQYSVNVSKWLPLMLSCAPQVCSILVPVFLTPLLSTRMLSIWVSLTLPVNRTHLKIRIVTILTKHDSCYYD